MINWIIDWLSRKRRLKKLLSVVNRWGIKHYLVIGDDQRRVISRYEPGDCLLIYAFAETTSLLQGSDFTHVAVGSDKADMICESLGSTGVTEKDILNLFPGVSRICIRRPRFSKEIRDAIAQRAVYYSNLPKKIQYDWEFDNVDKDEMSCSMFYYWCFNDILPNQFELRERFNRKLVVPDDIHKADRLFETVLDVKGPSYEP